MRGWLNEVWQRSRGLRRDIALVLLVKTLLLVVLVMSLAPEPTRRRIGADATGHHLLGADSPGVKEPAHER